MITMNIGARFLIDELTPDQKKMINTQNFRRFIIFCAFFSATRDLLSAVTLTIIFVLFISEIFTDTEDMKNKKKKIITSVDIQNELNGLINKVKMMEDGKGENETLIDSRFAFVKLVQKIPGVDFSNFNTAKTQLIAAFGNTNPQTEAILQKIIDLLDTVELEYYASGKKFPKNAEFKDVNTFVYDGGTINRGNKSSTEFYEEVLKVKSVFGKVKTRKEKLLIIKKLVYTAVNKQEKK